MSGKINRPYHHYNDVSIMTQPIIDAPIDRSTAEITLKTRPHDPTHSEDRTITHTLLFSSIRCISTL